MKTHSIRSLAVLTIALAIPASFGASAEKKQAEAQLLDHNQYACSNCFFGDSDYYFCFRADDRILIGREKIPTFNWRDPNQNYFAKYHKGWQTWEAPGQTVNIRYDDKHIWVPRANGKEVKLKQDYTQDIFTNPACRAVVRKPQQY